MKRVTELRRALHFPLPVYMKDTTQQQPRGQDTRDQVGGGGHVHALGGPGGHHLPAPPCPATWKFQSPVVWGFYGGFILGKVD